MTMFAITFTYSNITTCSMIHSPNLYNNA